MRSITWMFNVFPDPSKTSTKRKISLTSLQESDTSRFGGGRVRAPNPPETLTKRKILVTSLQECDTSGFGGGAKHGGRGPPIPLKG